MLERFKRNWKSNTDFRKNALYGTIATLAGCVVFWNLHQHKTIRKINEELEITTPKNLKTAAWISNLALKSIGAGFFVKALTEYK